MQLCVMQCICDFGSKTAIFRWFHLFYAFIEIMRLPQYTLIEILLYLDFSNELLVE